VGGAQSVLSSQRTPSSPRFSGVSHDTPCRTNTTYEINAPTVHLMAWVWWLMAPVLTTATGASVVWWRGRRALGKTAPSHAMAQHRQLLRALAQGHPDAAEPVNLVILPAPVDRDTSIAS
jgi:hypothetical protein